MSRIHGCAFKDTREIWESAAGKCSALISQTRVSLLIQDVLEQSGNYRFLKQFPRAAAFPRADDVTLTMKSITRLKSPWVDHSRTAVKMTPAAAWKDGNQSKNCCYCTLWKTAGSNVIYICKNPACSLLTFHPGCVSAPFPRSAYRPRHSPPFAFTHLMEP